MPVTAQRLGTVVCDDGVYKAVNFRDIPETFNDGVYNPLAFQLYASCDTAPGETISISILIGGVTFGLDSETFPVNPQAYSGAFVSTDGKTFVRAGGPPNTCIFTNGLLEGGFTVLISVAPGSPSKTVSLLFLFNDNGSQAGIDLDPGPGPNGNPSDPDAALQANSEVPTEDDIKVTWQINSTDETGFKVEREFNGSGTWTIVGGVPVGISAYVDSYVGLVSGSYKYRITGFNATGFSGSVITPSIVYFSPPAIPDIDVTGSGGIDMGGAPSIVFMLNPSGIYTLVLNKTHDTLYERLGAITTINVKIPDPFVKTGYMSNGEEEAIYHYGAVRMRVVGAGNLKSTLYGLDDVETKALPVLAMSATNKKQPTLLVNFSQERAAFELKTTEIDEIFKIHRILIFLKPIYVSHPQ